VKTGKIDGLIFALARLQKLSLVLETVAIVSIALGL